MENKILVCQFKKDKTGQSDLGELLKATLKISGRFRMMTQYFTGNTSLVKHLNTALFNISSLCFHFNTPARTFLQFVTSLETFTIIFSLSNNFSIVILQKTRLYVVGKKEFAPLFLRTRKFICRYDRPHFIGFRTLGIHNMSYIYFLF